MVSSTGGAPAAGTGGSGAEQRPGVPAQGAAVAPEEGPSPYGVFDRTDIDRTGQAEAFDSIGDRYDEAFPHKDAQVVSGSWLAEQLPAGSRVLDLGCGTGLPTSRQLVDAGHEVIGVDLSEGMLKLCREHVPEASFHHVDIADMEASDLGPFDGAAAYFSLLMLPRSEIPHALAMLHRQIRGEGPLALGMVEADVNDFAIPFLGNTIRVSGHLRDDLRRIVDEAGFDVVDEEAVSYAPASTDVPPEIQLFLHCRRRP